MTKELARLTLEQAFAAIFAVECQMDINKSHVRKLAYNARIELSRFANAIRTAELKDDDISSL